MLSAMGTEPRLRIMRLLLSAHPDGLVVGDIPDELGIAGIDAVHHLESSRTRTSSAYAAKARSCGTPPIRRAEGTAGVSLCRVLLAESGRRARGHDKA